MYYIEGKMGIIRETVLNEHQQYIRHIVLLLLELSKKASVKYFWKLLSCFLQYYSNIIFLRLFKTNLVKCLKITTSNKSISPVIILTASVCHT